MRGAAFGLVLLLCLAASGWAWLRVPPVDVTGTYVRVVTLVDGPAVCAAPDVLPGGMRIEEAQVVFATSSCQIASRDDVVSPAAGDGPFSMVVLELICGEDPAGPEGQSATIHVTRRAEVTTYIGVGSSYVPAHATYRSCGDLPDNGS